MIGKINLYKLPEEETEKLPQSIKSRFMAVLDVTRWEFETPEGKIPYAGVLVNGPKPIPGGSFQCIADIVLTEFPPEGVAPETLAGLNEIISAEVKKRAVIQKEDGTLGRIEDNIPDMTKPSAPSNLTKLTANTHPPCVGKGSGFGMKPEYTALLVQLAQKSGDPTVVIPVTCNVCSATGKLKREGDVVAVAWDDQTN